MKVWRWLLVGGALLVAWLASPLASAWLSGAASPSDSSAICYSCKFAGELQGAAFEDRFRNAHPVPADAVEIRETGCDRLEADPDLSGILAVQQAYRMSRIEEVWSAETNRILRANFGNGMMSLLARCVQDSALAPACRARVKRAIDTHKARPEWKATEQRLAAEEAGIAAEADKRCDKLAQRWNAFRRRPSEPLPST